jgi:hypothetical protein
MWYDDFNSVFFITVGTMVFGFLGIVLRYAFLSKCDNVSICFGLIKIHRVVQIEEDVPPVEEVKEEQKEEEKV